MHEDGGPEDRDKSFVTSFMDYPLGGIKNWRRYVPLSSKLDQGIIPYHILKGLIATKTLNSRL